MCGCIVHSLTVSLHHTHNLKVCKGYMVEELHQHWQQQCEAQGRAEMSWEVFVRQKAFLKVQTAWRYRRLYWLCLDFPGMMLSGENFKSLVLLHDAIRSYLKDLAKMAKRGNPNLTVTYALFAKPVAWLPIPNPRPGWTRGDAVAKEKDLTFKVYTKNIMGFQREEFWRDTPVQQCCNFTGVGEFYDPFT